MVRTWNVKELIGETIETARQREYGDPNNPKYRLLITTKSGKWIRLDGTAPFVMVEVTTDPLGD